MEAEHSSFTFRCQSPYVNFTKKKKNARSTFVNLTFLWFTVFPVLFLHLYYTLKTYTCQAELCLDGRPVGAGAPNEKDGVAFRNYAVRIPLFSRSLDLFPDEFSEPFLYFLFFFAIILLHG